MIIYPAIDLRGGKVVRLKEGRPDQQTIFSDDPLETARQWQEAGAEWLHMVNLDGAFAEANDNSTILEKAAALGIKIQFGGGLRSLNDMAQALDQGAARIVIGTAAVKEPEIVAEAVRRFGVDAVCVALDAKDGKIATHGWQETTELTPIELGRQLAEGGLRHALYTDVRRDGSLIGANIQDTIALARGTGLQVIASGGVTSIAEIQQMARSKVVAGAVIGMALYEGKLTLSEALIAARTPNVS
jgi:phosphoribosylformimino-5-aminoimidazole carboxamide ribotide isomerase